LKKVKIRKRRKRKSKNTSPEFLEKLMSAIEGSGGVVGVIAQRMKQKYITTWQILQKAPEEIHEALEYEKEFVGDVAEQTLIEMMQQRMDFSTASRTAMQVLRSKKYRSRGFFEEKSISVEGGKRPIKIEQTNIIPLDRLKLMPIEMRKKLLEEALQDDKEEDKE